MNFNLNETDTVQPVSPSVNTLVDQLLLELESKTLSIVSVALTTYGIDVLDDRITTNLMPDGVLHLYIDQDAVLYIYPYDFIKNKNVMEVYQKCKFVKTGLVKRVSVKVKVR